MELLKEVALTPKTNNEWPSFFENSRKSNTLIRRMDCATYGETGMILLVQVYSSMHAELTVAINSIVTDPNVRAAYFNNISTNAAVGFIITKDSPMCRAVKGQMAFCKNCLLNARRNEDGQKEWQIILEETTVEILLGKLRSVGIFASIRYLRELQGNGHLTLRQDEVLKQALDKGYFDFPKKLNMNGLAQTFGISMPALSETLRRAEKKIVRAHYLR